MIAKDKIVDILKQCYDPEIPIDLWNLGLIYDIKIQEANEKEKSDINIVMSLTTPGCGMGQFMADDIRNRLENLDEVNQAFVEITFDPPWSPERMTDKGKSKLGFDPKPPDEEQLKNWE
jgi:metal-sulfur cluster biosynthetic enzyme